MYHVSFVDISGYLHRKVCSHQFFNQISLFARKLQLRISHSLRNKFWDVQDGPTSSCICIATGGNVKDRLKFSKKYKDVLEQTGGKLFSLMKPPSKFLEHLEKHHLDPINTVFGDTFHPKRALS